MGIVKDTEQIPNEAAVLEETEWEDGERKVECERKKNVTVITFYTKENMKSGRNSLISRILRPTH